jgi:FeS assembly SUF system protein
MFFKKNDPPPPPHSAGGGGGGLPPHIEETPLRTPSASFSSTSSPSLASSSLQVKEEEIPLPSTVSASPRPSPHYPLPSPQSLKSKEELLSLLEAVDPVSEEEKDKDPRYAPEVLKEDVVRVIKTCYDPEIPVNIYELGLIYEIQVEARQVSVKMTLTTPHCPAAESLPQDVLNKVKHLPGVRQAKVDVVWEPTWTKEMMSEAAQLQLGLL